VGGENETESEAGQLLVLQSVHDGSQHFFRRLLVVFVCHEIRGYVVGELVGVDVNESTEQNAKLWRSEKDGDVVENAVEGFSTASKQTFATGLFLLMLSLSRLRFGVDLNGTARMVDAAIGIGADGACTSCAFAVDDDCGLGRFAVGNRFGVFVLVLGCRNLRELVARERTGAPFLWVAVRRLDLY
jgi:hypothetical protein